MAIGQNISQSAMYAVPASKSLLCKNWTLGSFSVTAALTVRFVVDRYVDPVTASLPIREELGYVQQSGSGIVINPVLKKFAAKTILVTQALSATSTGPASVSAECLLVDDISANQLQQWF
jgi:hypothetical protein